jgi:uroporphyrin-III C-methyltransferase
MMDRAPPAFPVLPTLAPGTVWLVGAGPGDPGLLSLLAAKALNEADVVVYDALVSAPILALARPGARLEFAGKRGGRPSPSQRDISARLIELGRSGLRVLRLKGGDPCVFGRGAEEALALAAAGIPFRLVPGITAAQGALAYAGVPMTHRDSNAAVTLLTGHAQGGGLPDGLDWAALAKGAPVLILYMALGHLAAITERLIAGGRAPETPALMISHATLPNQRIVETTLAGLATDAARHAVEAPCLIALGETIRLRAALDWTAPAAQREAAANALLAALRAEAG